MSTTNATSVPRQDVKKAFRKFIYDNFKFSKVRNSHSNKKVSLCAKHIMERPVFLLLGTNLGNRISNLTNATQAIERRVGKVVYASSVYETSAWGKTDQPAFLNQAVQITTRLEPEAVLKDILSIEEGLGRKRNEKWGERTIDIDILLFGGEVCQRPNLVIPHPQLANRRFTLVPLNEIAPDFVHPVFKKTVAELLAACPDALSVIRFADAPAL